MNNYQYNENPPLNEFAKKPEEVSILLNFDKTNNQLIKVFCPSNQLNDAMNLIDFINIKR